MNKNLSSLVLVTLLMLCGCTTRLPPVADEKMATESLSKVLNAWKNGDSLESLEKQTPPLYFNEQFWAKGSKLQDFSIIGGQLDGQGWNCVVELTMSKSDGQTQKRRVDYRIDTQPNIVIVQQP